MLILHSFGIAYPKMMEKRSEENISATSEETNKRPRFSGADGKQKRTKSPVTEESERSSTADGERREIEGRPHGETDAVNPEEN